MLQSQKESDHAALKQLLRPMRGFRTLAGAKVAIAGSKTFPTIRKDQFENCAIGVFNENNFVAKRFPDAAKAKKTSSLTYGWLTLMQRTPPS